MPASPEHQKLVLSLINYFKVNLGFRILAAAHSGFVQPDNYGRHAPDIVAMDGNNVIHLAEAKANYEDIYSQNAEEEFFDFSNRVMIDTRVPVTLHIVVYKENEQDLLNKLKQIGLSPLVGSRIKIWTL